MYFNPVRITVLPTYRSYQKYPLPVNMVVVVNKLKIRKKFVNLLKESSGNCPKYRNMWILRHLKKGEI